MNQLKILSYLFLITSTLFLACKKDDSVDPEEPFEQGYIMSFKSNGIDYIFDDTTYMWNSYYKSEDQDQLSMYIKDSSKNTIGMNFFRLNLYNRKFPFKMTYLPDSVYGEVQYLPYDTIYKGSTNGQEDSVNYFGYNNRYIQEVEFNFLNFKNNTIEGTFHGTISTNTGREMFVEEGYFRMTIIREK